MQTINSFFSCIDACVIIHVIIIDQELVTSTVSSLLIIGLFRVFLNVRERTSHPPDERCKGSVNFAAHGLTKYEWRSVHLSEKPLRNRTRKKRKINIEMSQSAVSILVQRATDAANSNAITTN